MEEYIDSRGINSLGMTGGLVLFFFFLSGAVGLIYEIVWTRLLRLVMGNTVFSITTVLCAFMGGLALGSFLGGKIIDRRNDPLKIYALLVGTVGIYSLFLPGIIKATELFYRPIYQNYHTSFYLFSLLRFLFCGILLLLPTTLMGATLPVLTKFFVRASDRIARTVGKLYAVNTFGAVLGSFCAGFLLIPAWGVSRTIYFASLISIFICFFVYFLHYRMRPWQKEPAGRKPGIGEEKTGLQIKPGPGQTVAFSRNLLRLLLIGYGLSGFAALIYEIAWTRILSLIIGSSVYAFSLMLTAFIFGLALGSIIFSRFIDRRRDLVLFLAIIEMIIGFSALMAVPLFGQLPVFIVKMILRFSHSFWLLQLAEFGLVFLLMLIPTTMMGAAFPLASRIYTQSVAVAGSSVGSVYAANTLGSILGAFISAFILLPWLGIQKTIMAAVLINIIIGCGFLGVSQTLSKRKKGIITTGVIIVAIIVFRLFPSWSVELISSGPYLYLTTMELSQSADRSVSVFEKTMKKLKVLYHKEGISTTVTVREDAQGHRYFLVNGKGDASSSEDMPTQELLAHVPLLLHPYPRSVLVIGLASGVTLGSAGLYPVESLDCVEISPEAVEASHYFNHVNYEILKDPRVELIIEDGRNHLALTDKRYDVIISEPSNPWIAGISDLFTQEFFRLCRQRLNPKGIVCVWLHAYNIDDKAFRSIVYTFHTVFPYFSIWESSLGVDFLLIGSQETISLDYGTLLRRLQDEGISHDLKRISIKNAVDFLAHFVMDEKAVETYTQAGDVRIHTDDNALVEFSAPRTLYMKDARIPLMGALNMFRGEGLAFLSYSGGDEKELDEVKAKVGRLIQAKKDITNGNIYLAKGKQKLAIAEFEKAMSLNPEELSTMEKYVEFLAYVYLSQGQNEQARRMLENVLVIRPHYTKAMINMGIVYFRMNEHKKAEQLFKKVLDIDENSAEAYLQLGYLYMLGKEFHQAISLFNQLLRLQPENTQAYLYLGETYQALGQTKTAIQFWQKSIDLQPDLAIAHLELGNAYFEIGDFQEAEIEWEQALAEKGIDIPTHLVNLGMQYFQSEQYNKAIQAWRKAGELKMDDPHLLYNISLAYYKQGEYRAAARELKESLRLRPDNQSARTLLQGIESLLVKGSPL